MKKGFTLFEILITLAIVGIIAVLAMPNLQANIHQKTYVSLLKSANNAFKTATQQVMIDERTTSLADTIYASSPENFLKRYFKLSLYCGNDYSKCMATSYKSLDGTNSVTVQNMLPSNNFFCGTVDSGIAVCITSMSPDSANTYGNSIAIVDVNGVKLPNQNGRDLFSFNIYSDGKIGNQYDLSDNDAKGVSCSNYASTAGYGGACYSKIVSDGWKMDY